MKEIKDIIWTRLLPDKDRMIDGREWTMHGRTILQSRGYSRNSPPGA